MDTLFPIGNHKGVSMTATHRRENLQKVSQIVLPQQMILKSPPITIFPCIHTTHHTNIHSHTFTRFGQPHSDVQSVTQSTLPSCTHTLHTRRKSRFAAPAQILRQLLHRKYRHSPFDVVLMSLQEKPLVEGYYSHLLHTHTH